MAFDIAEEVERVIDGLPFEDVSLVRETRRVLTKFAERCRDATEEEHIRIACFRCKANEPVERRETGEWHHPWVNGAHISSSPCLAGRFYEHYRQRAQEDREDG